MFACPFVRPQGKISYPTGRIFLKFDLNIFRKSIHLLKFNSNLIRITGTWHEDLCTFFIISRSFLIRMRTVRDKSYRENQNTRVMSNNVFFRKSYLLWENLANANCTLDNKGYKHTFIICNIYAFPLQQRLHKLASMLRYTYIARLVNYTAIWQ